MPPMIESTCFLPQTERCLRVWQIARYRSAVTATRVKMEAHEVVELIHVDNLQPIAPSCHSVSRLLSRVVGRPKIGFSQLS